MFDQSPDQPSTTPSTTPGSSPLPARPFGAVLTAMVTPFHADGSLDLPAAARLAVHLVANGHDGVVVSGTTGEAPTTTDAEQDALLRTVLEAVGHQAQVIAGVGTNDTRHSVELAEQAAKAGAHGLLVVTPYYNRPPAQSLVAHFSAVADATELPCMLYDIPVRTGTRIGTPVLQQLAEHPRIVAVKDATGDLLAGTQLMATTDLAYYCGDDALNLPWLAVGAAGMVSVVGHVAGPQYAQMVRAVDAGDLPTARALHTRLLPAVEGIMSAQSQGAIRAKAAMQVVGVLSERTMRMPLLTASDAEVAQLRVDLAAADLLPEVAA